MDGTYETHGTYGSYKASGHDMAHKSHWAHESRSCVKEGFTLPRPVARRGLRLGREQE
jgi:hypothetical protein